MSQEGDVERIPLLRGAYHNLSHIQNNDNRNNRRSYISYLGFGFIILATLLLLINISYYFIESNEEILTKGVSKIPYEYYLGLKSDNWIGINKFDYVIETSPPSYPTFSNLFTDFTQDSTSHDRLKIADIIAKNYKAWNPAYYEVREERHNPRKNYTELTTQSYMSGLWFIIWPPKVHISFASFDDENDGGRKTKFIRDDDQDKLLKCDYEIRWNYKYFGEIYRKCPKQENWVNIAYVKGSSEWGMQWLDPERTETYGIVTKPSPGRQMR
jgi:hypothetical protein